MRCYKLWVFSLTVLISSNAFAEPLTLKCIDSQGDYWNGISFVHIDLSQMKADIEKCMAYKEYTEKGMIVDFDRPEDCYTKSGYKVDVSPKTYMLTKIHFEKGHQVKNVEAIDRESGYMSWQVYWKGKPDGNMRNYMQCKKHKTVERRF